MSKTKTTKTGTVTKIVPPFDATDPEKAEIHIHQAEPLYQELRVPNSLSDEKGHKVKLKNGAEVEVHIEADKSATTPKST
jgi:hypothetical protein